MTPSAVATDVKSADISLVAQEKLEISPGIINPR